MISKRIFLTPHFRLSEFAVSTKRPDLAALIEFTSEEAERLRRFCWQYLEPIRAWAGLPVVITSGKRSPELNYAVRGSENSDHMMAYSSCAVDFWIPGGPGPTEVADFIKRELPLWKQLGTYGGSHFNHLSGPDHTLRRGETFMGD